ncbi:MAG: CehA/McbA family metallohydrolase [Thermodesulfobacteriota bacterium]
MNADTIKNQDRVRLSYGPLIPDGDSRSSRDISLMNGSLAVTFALGSNPPWGLLKGGLLDAAVVRNGQPGTDLLAVFDFLPDNWGGWPNSYIRTRVLESGPDKGVVRVERDWGAVELVTSYTLEKDLDRLLVVTTMTNNSPDSTGNLSSGYALWPKRGFTHTPPGLQGVRQGAADQALADWFLCYDEDWGLALHAPFLDFIDHYGKGMFGRHDLSPGESRTFTGWLQFCKSGDISPVLEYELVRKGRASGRLTGKVVDEKGDPLDQPIIIIEKNEQTYTWTLGHRGSYSLVLPEGEYRILATGLNYGSSEPQPVKIFSQQEHVQDFSGLTTPARLHFQILDKETGVPLDARLSMTRGRKPALGFLGQSTFFTDLDPAGRAEFSIAPGAYTFKIAHGEGFLAPAEYIEILAQPGQEVTIPVELFRITDPGTRGWFGVDLHHHTDVLDGATGPEEAVRSQLAAGLDITFVSDHDSTANNKRIAEISAQRQVMFLPAMEISRSWGHFNIYPLLIDPRKETKPVSGEAREIFRTSRRMGAAIITANHPYSTYGYLRNLQLDRVPGGFAPGFDLLEINYQYPAEPVIEKAWELWNQGIDCYLTAGTDSHDVQVDVSGSVRMFVYLSAKPTVAKLVDALKKGRSYASFGPLVFPEIIFGSRLQAPVGQPLELRFEVLAVTGLARVDLIEKGEIVAFEQIEHMEPKKTVTFMPRPEKDTWYALVVTDTHDRKAYTNPIRIRVS